MLTSLLSSPARLMCWALPALFLLGFSLPAVHAAVTIEIDQQPVSVTVNPGKPATFSVEARRSDYIPAVFQYRWQTSATADGTWANVFQIDNPTATTAQFVIPQVSAGDNGKFYRVLMYDDTGLSAVVSNAVTLTVTENVIPLTILAQPQDAYYVGDLYPDYSETSGTLIKPALFRVIAQAGSSISYQWKYSPNNVLPYVNVPATYTRLTLDYDENGIVVNDDKGNPVYVPKVYDSPNQGEQQANYTINSLLKRYTDQYTYTSVTDGTYYQCWMTSADNPTVVVKSDPVRLHIPQALNENTVYIYQTDSVGGFGLGDLYDNAPIIPSSDSLIYYGKSLVFGSKLTLNVAYPAGASDLFFQWQRSNGINLPYTDINGKNSPSITIDSFSSLDDLSTLRCLVRSKYGEVFPTASVLLSSIRFSNVKFIQQPMNRAVKPGQTAIFTAEMNSPPINSGVGYVFNWYIKRGSARELVYTDQDYSDKTTSEFQYTSIPLTDDGAQISCECQYAAYSNSTGDYSYLTVKSNPATLTVAAGLILPSYTLAAIADQYATAGQQAAFKITSQVGALPQHFAWQYSPTGLDPWTQVGSDQDSYTTKVLSDVDLSGFFVRVLTWNGAVKPTGSLATAGTSNIAKIIPIEAPRFVAQPIDATVALIFQNTADTTVGASFNAECNFMVTAIGYPKPTYQWQVMRDGVTWENMAIYPQDLKKGITEPKLELVVYANDDGNRYRCVADNGIKVYSDPVTLRTLIPTKLLVQPRSSEVTAGDRAQFTADYQILGDNTIGWQVSADDGVSWVQVADDMISNVQIGDAQRFHSVLTVPAVQIADSGKKYRIIITQAGVITTSDGLAKLAVSNQSAAFPRILINPDSVSVEPGQIPKFSIIASGPNLSYQWQSTVVGISERPGWQDNFEPVENGSGANSPDYTAPAIRLGVDTYRRYRCVVTNPQGVATSNYAEMTVVKPFQIIQQPKSNSAAPGDQVLFAVNAIGFNLGYQWQTSDDGVEFTNIAAGAGNGAQTERLTVIVSPLVVGKSPVSYFRARISSNYKRILYSDIVVLAKVDKSLPVTITAQPQAQQGRRGFPVTFAVGAAGQAPLVYQWQRLRSQEGEVWTNLPATIPGATGPVLTLGRPVGLDNRALFRCLVGPDALPTSPALLELDLSEYLEVTAITDTSNTSDKVDADGNPIGNYPKNSAQDVVYSPKSIMAGWIESEQGNFIKTIGLYAGGRRTILSLWNSKAGFDDNDSILGATRINDSLPAIFTWDCSRRDGLIQGDGKVIVRIEMTSNYESDPTNKDYENGTRLKFEFTRNGVPRYNVPLNVRTTDGLVGGIVSLKYTYNGRETQFITQPILSPKQVHEPVNLSVKALGAGPVTYQWFKRPFNASIWTAISAATGANYDFIADALDDGASFKCEATDVSRIPLSSNIVELKITTKAIAPTIITQPIRQTVDAGMNANFMVVANGTDVPLDRLTYAWSIKPRGGTWTDVGVTTARYDRVTTSADDGSLVRCMVSNSAGVVFTTEASLTIWRPVVITEQPTNQSALAGQRVQFSVKATGSEPISYNWRFSYDGGNNWRSVKQASADIVYTSPITEDLPSPELISDPESWKDDLATKTPSGTLFQVEIFNPANGGATKIYSDVVRVSVPKLGPGLRVDFTTRSTPEAEYEGRNMVAVWIEDLDGKFIKTIGNYSTAFPLGRNYNLSRWAAQSGEEALDGITGATRVSHDTPVSVVWDLKDKDNNHVPLGKYLVWIEMADKEGTENSKLSTPGAARYAFPLTFKDFTKPIGGDLTINDKTIPFENLKFQYSGDQITVMPPPDEPEIKAVNSFADDSSYNNYIYPDRPTILSVVTKKSPVKLQWQRRGLIDMPAISFTDDKGTAIKKDDVVKTIPAHKIVGWVDIPGANQSTYTFTAEDKFESAPDYDVDGNLLDNNDFETPYQYDGSSVEIMVNGKKLAVEGGHKTSLVPSLTAVVRCVEAIDASVVKFPNVILDENTPLYFDPDNFLLNLIQPDLVNLDPLILNNLYYTLNFTGYPVSVDPLSPTPINITQQPQGVIVDEFTQPVLSVIANGPQPLIYTWRKYNDLTAVWEPVVGASGPDVTTLRLPLITSAPEKNNLYQCLVSNAFVPPSAPVASAGALVRFVPTPKAPMLMMPVVANNIDGQVATFTIAVDAYNGDGILKYQWLLNGSPIEGAIHPSYTNPDPLKLSDAGQKYQCVVKNDIGETTSDVLTLIVQRAAGLEITFTTKSAGGRYAPENVLAVWAERSDGTFVKTIARWGEKYYTNLLSWNEKSGPDLDEDGKMGPTRLLHPALTKVFWDLKDRNNRIVPDGDYKIVFELADQQFALGAMRTLSDASEGLARTELLISIADGKIPLTTDSGVDSVSTLVAEMKTEASATNAESTSGGCGTGGFSAFFILGLIGMGFGRRKKYLSMN